MAIVEKYVTVAGGGLHDGTSEANAWTFTEALANVVAGDRVNVKVGTHAVSTSNTVNGTQADQIRYRGYVSTIGDLDDLPLGTMVAGTDMPLIVGTGNNLGMRGQYTTVSHIAFEGVSSYSQLWTFGQGAVVRSCVFLCNNSLAYDAVRGATGTLFHDCYISTTTTAEAAKGEQSTFVDCVVIAPNAGKALIARVAINCTVVGTGIGVSVANTEPVIYLNNTIVGFTTGIEMNAYNHGHLVAGNYFSNCTTAISNIKLGIFDVYSNCYHSVTTQISGIDNQLLPVTDATDQFVNSAAGDYTLLATSNGYNAMKPNVTAGVGTTTKRDIGHIQHADAGGGGVTNYNPFRNPVF